MNLIEKLLVIFYQDIFLYFFSYSSYSQFLSPYISKLNGDN